jgi:pyroglutamyl-peptidase
MEEVPLSIEIKASASRSAFVEVSWRLKRTPDAPGVTGKDWFTLVKEREEWKILNLTFWQDPPPESSANARPPAEGPAAAKPKIVVSGFEQFGGRSINASSEIAQAIVKAFPQLDITFVKVPVVWGAPKQAIERAHSLNPSIWIAFGEGRNTFQIETVARNTRGQFRDNKNEVPAANEIDPNGAQQLTLDFPAEALSNRLRDLGYDCASSSDAGKYLCEEMLYSLLEEKSLNNTRLKQALFIHVPVHGSKIHIRGKEVALSDDNLRLAARDIFEAIAAVLAIPVSK